MGPLRGIDLMIHYTWMDPRWLIPILNRKAQDICLKGTFRGNCYGTSCGLKKERNVLFNNTLNTFYLVIWHRTYDKGPLR